MNNVAKVAKPASVNRTINKVVVKKAMPRPVNVTVNKMPTRVKLRKFKTTLPMKKMSAPKKMPVGIRTRKV